MKLYELLEVLTAEDIITVFDKDNEKIAWYDGKDSIPSVLNGAEVIEVRPYTDGTLGVRTDFANNIKALDYLSSKIHEVKETISTDEYHYDNEMSVNNAVRDCMTDIINYCEAIRNNLDALYPWNDGIEY